MKRGLQAIRLEARLKNISTVQGGVKAVGGVNEALSIAKDLAAAGEWNDSLRMIENLRDLWELKDQNVPPGPALSQPPPQSHPRSSPRSQRKTNLETAKHISAN